jgi:hypothetical protein
MTAGDAVLFAVLGWLGLHQVLTRIPGLERSQAAFLSIQIVNLTVISALLSVGIPSLTGNLKVFNWIIALLLVVHTFQNTTAYSAARRARLQGQRDDADAKREQVAAALAAGARTPSPDGEDRAGQADPR